jgi:hypothetical protein
VPALGDEAALRTAAETVREAEREATRLGDTARTIAAHVPIVVEQPSASPRRGLGAALIVMSLLAIGAGWAISIPATIFGGILGVAVGAALLGGLIGSSRTGGSPATPTASDQYQPAAEQAETLAEQARAAWRGALGGLGLSGELRIDQLDDILTTLATIRTAEQAADRAGALAETETAAAAEIAARATAALTASGVEPPTELGQLRDTVDRTLHHLEELRAQAAAGRNELQAWQDRHALAQQRVDELSRDDDALMAAAQALDLELTDAQRTVLEQQVAAASEEHAAAIEARGGIRALVANAEDSSDLASLAQAAADAEAAKLANDAKTPPVLTPDGTNMAADQADSSGGGGDSSWMLWAGGAAVLVVGAVIFFANRGGSSTQMQGYSRLYSRRRGARRFARGRQYLNR